MNQYRPVIGALLLGAAVCVLLVSLLVALAALGSIIALPDSPGASGAQDQLCPGLALMALAAISVWVGYRLLLAGMSRLEPPKRPEPRGFPVEPINHGPSDGPPPTL